MSAAARGVTTGRADTVTSLLTEIADVGADPVRGGFSRPVFSAAEHELREWFTAHALRRGLDVQTDRNGLIQAWWHTPDLASTGAVLTGSHLDSVPGGGAFDGPLGIASALVAIDRLIAGGVRPIRPLVIAVFPEEEGSRCGVACLGSRLLSGTIDPARALRLRDQDGDTFADVAARNGLDPQRIGVDDTFLNDVSAFVELHIEQGMGLVDADRAVGIGSSILGHGRWRLTVRGQGNHAGTTLMADRRDPMVAAARIIQAVRDIARRHPPARATVGRIIPIPGGTNVIASRVEFWLDVRHPHDLETSAVVAHICEAAVEFGAEEGCTIELVQESLSATVHFDPTLRDRLRRVLPDAPILPTGAGHDAGVLAARLPTGMLFVRNPTGISHSPEEHAVDADVEAGTNALAAVLEDLLT